MNAPGDPAVIWHDVECGGYDADLGLWEGLAADADGPVLDLGCGTGRVALKLARDGHDVTGLDLDTSLIGALNDRAVGLPARAAVGDARDFNLGSEFGLAVAPMQLIQLFASIEERVECLRCLERHLRPGGRAALAIVDQMSAAGGDLLPLPDVREVEGWVYSSQPLDVRLDSSAMLIRRLRQVVSPQGSLEDEENEIELQALAAPDLGREAEEAGLRPVAWLEVPATEAHVGSTVVLLERGR